MTRRSQHLALALAVCCLSACGSTVQPTSTTALGATVGGPGTTELGGTSPSTGAASAPGVGSDAALPGDGTTRGPAAAGGGVVAQPAASGAVTPAGGSAPAPAAGAPAASIPAKGRGWDETTVRIGVTTQKDVSTAANNIGIESLNTGDQEGQARAAAAYLNERGGLFGRKVQIVFRDHATASLQSDPAGQSQATCTYFTRTSPSSR